MILDLHTHINGNGPMQRDANAITLARMATLLGLDGLMLGCHDWTAPRDLIERMRAMYPHLTFIKSAEITTDGGHLLALNIREITPAIHGDQHRPVECVAAIQEIQRQGGKAIMAHPFGHGHPWAYRLEEPAVADRLDGVEIRNGRSWRWHGIPAHNVDCEAHPNWLQSGGSDCHPWEPGEFIEAGFATDVDLAWFGELV